MILRSQMGAAVLIMTIILLSLSTLIILFAADFGVTQGKSIANLNRRTTAMQAADAGLEFGINYLRQNSTTILANPVSGFISAYSDENTNNVSLSNGGKYTIAYANPTANNYNLIRI